MSYHDHMRAIGRVLLLLTCLGLALPGLAVVGTSCDPRPAAEGMPVAHLHEAMQDTQAPLSNSSAPLPTECPDVCDAICPPRSGCTDAGRCGSASAEFVGATRHPGPSAASTVHSGRPHALTSQRDGPDTPPPRA